MIRFHHRGPPFKLSAPPWALAPEPDIGTCKSYVDRDRIYDPHGRLLDPCGQKFAALVSDDGTTWEGLCCTRCGFEMLYVYKRAGREQIPRGVVRIGLTSWTRQRGKVLAARAEWVRKAVGR